MKSNPFSLLALAALTMLFGGSVSTQAQGTAFTYQGRLDAGDTPVTGLYDFEFHLFSVASGGGALTGGTAVFALPVTNGLFTVTLDFLNSFPGADRWLEIKVRTSGAPSFNTLTPRQKLTPTPYAITAGNISGTLPSSGLSGAYNSQVTLFNPANQINGSFNGSFTGNGAGVSNVNAAQLNGLTSANFWQTNGNPNANPTNGAFVGTRDNFPLEVKVNGRRALRLEPNTNSPNVIGGHAANVVSPGAYAATIGGGGDGFYPNSVSASYGTVVGGGNNTASGVYATAGGAGNTASGPGSVALGRYNVSGGEYSAALGNSNTASGPSSIALGLNTRASGEAAVAAGRSAVASGNSAVALGESSTASGPLSLAAGWNARATASSSVSIGHVTTSDGSAAVALGNSTRAVGNASFAAGLATVAGGNSSTALGELTDASGPASTALGYGTRASGTYSTALGWGSEAAGNFSVSSGYASKTAGERSFAAGTRALATNEGTFVWADASRGLGTNQAFGSTGTNQFLVRATGGVGINTNRPQEALHVVGRFLRVDGEQNEAAYIGGDGAGGDVQVGSLNSNVNAVALYNAATGDYMNLFAKDLFLIGSVNGDGAGLTSLPAGQLTGTVPDARLSANVALRNGGNTFNGNQTVASGNLTFNSANSSITFPEVPGANSPMINLFANGTVNADRMVLAHSPTYFNYGLQYRDNGDQFNFLGGGFPVLSVGLSSARIGINTDNPQSALDVRGTLTAEAYAGTPLTITPVNDVGNGATANFRSGSAANIISNGVVGGFIGGGGNPSYPHRVGGNYASVLGGSHNEATGHAATAMGEGTKASGRNATSMGAETIASAQNSTAMGAGTTASGIASTAMGYQTTASGGGSLAFGSDTVAAGVFSTAGGYLAQANHGGTFVWADSTSVTPFASTGDNQFLVRATGGVGINTSNPNGAALAVNGTAAATTVSVSGSIRVPGAGIGTTGPAFVHRVTAGNIDPFGTHRTTIDHPLCNGDANAILIITHNFNPGNTGGTLDTNPTSVYYNGGIGKWQIYHDNLGAAPMTVGNAWNVLVFKP